LDFSRATATVSVKAVIDIVFASSLILFPNCQYPSIKAHLEVKLASVIIALHSSINSGVKIISCFSISLLIAVYTSSYSENLI